jgi:signal transduction histidine kinase
LRQANEELEQRVAERTAELQRTIGELRQANAAKDAFVAAVSYELRTPLTGVLGMAETLQAQSRGPLNEQQMHYVAIIHAGATRLQEMVNSILSYTQAVAATEPLASEPCRLADLCAISARSLRPKAERKQQRIEVEVTPPDLQIRSDAHVLVRVLDDLLDNAVKFTPEQGRVGVSVAPSPAGQAVELVVWDTGVGISAEHLTQLFKPFTQVDQRLARTYEGLGLGLAYVKRQVDRLSGAIAVESRIGEGSRFVVTLPVQPPA